MGLQSFLADSSAIYSFVLFPPLNLSTSTSTSKLSFPRSCNLAMLNSDNLIHCGSIPLLVHESSPSSDNQGPFGSLGRVNLLDFFRICHCNEQ